MRTINILLLLFLIVMGTIGSENYSFAQVRSDRAIVDAFEETVKVVSEMIDKAQTAQECAEINTMIEQLEKENLQYKELLDKALYPDNFAATFVNLRGKLLIRQNDLGIIQAQYERIVELELQIRELAAQVDSLSQQNEHLIKTIKVLAASGSQNAVLLDSLNRLVVILRKNLHERDKLIFAMVDSLFLQFDKNVSAMTDIEKQRIYGKFEQRNVLSNIKRAIVNNIQFLEATTLSPSDYLDITRQQAIFESQWKAFGPQIAAIYVSAKKKKTEITTVDSLLTTWSSKVQSGMWNSIASLCTDNGFPLPPFTNGTEFYMSLVSYIDDEIKNTKQDPEDVRARRYNDFRDKIWVSSLKSQWLPLLVETGHLSTEQKATIETKMEEWKKSITPTSWIVYALIVTFLIIFVVALFAFRKKKDESE